MLNKFMCLIGRHEYEKGLEYVLHQLPVKSWNGNYFWKERVTQVEIHKCKHCGARK